MGGDHENRCGGIMRIDPETLILRALLDGDAYATEIIERIEELSGGELSICMGTVQPTLFRMRGVGLVEPVEYDDQGPDAQNLQSGRRRLYYRLTSQGESESSHRMKILSDLFPEWLS